MCVWRSALAALVALVVAASLVVAGPASAVHAAPSDIAAQIDAQWRQLEPTIERFNAVTERLAAQQHKADALAEKIRPLALEVKVAQVSIQPLVAHIYAYGPTDSLTALLSASSAHDAFNLVATAERIAAARQARLAGTLALKQKYEAQKRPLDVLVAALAAQRAELAKARTTITKRIHALDALRVKAFGTTVAPGKVKPVACPQVYTGDAGSRAAQWACNQIGKPYVWGADGPGSFDCSGLTMQAWRHVGVSLPHNAYQQKHSIPAVHRAALRAGDLVFYYPGISHVSIYVGNGWVVSAPHSGDVVRMKRYNEVAPIGYGRP